MLSVTIEVEDHTSTLLMMIPGVGTLRGNVMQLGGETLYELLWLMGKVLLLLLQDRFNVELLLSVTYTTRDLRHGNGDGLTLLSSLFEELAGSLIGNRTHCRLMMRCLTLLALS
jgi:hypothetical protein